MTEGTTISTEARVAAVEFLLQAVLVESVSLVERPQEALRELERSAATLLDRTDCDEQGISKAEIGRSIGDMLRIVRRQLHATIAQ